MDIFSQSYIFERIFYELNSGLREILIIASIPMLIWGIIQALFGYKIFRIMNVIQGVVIGGIIGALIGAVLGVISGGSDGIAVGAVIGGILLGIVGGFLANAFYMIGVFCSAFGTGFLISALFMIFITKSLRGCVGAGAVGGLLFGIMACVFHKTIIIIQTALTGGASVGGALFVMTNPTVAMISIIVVSIVGIFVQFRMTQTPKTAAEVNPDNSGNVQTGTSSQAIGKAAVQQAAPITPQQTVQQTVQSTVQQSNAGGQGSNALGTMFAQMGAAASNTNQNYLSEKFSREIYEEIAFVFPDLDNKRIRYMPDFSENGEWKCTCGNKCNGEHCIYCGMNKSELREKLNYQYLSKHRADRLQEIEIIKEQKKTEKAEKWKERKERLSNKINKIINSFKAFIIKHKKALIISTASVVVLTTAVLLIVNNPTVRMKYFLGKAQKYETKGDSYSAEQYYLRAYEEKPNLDSCIYLAAIKCEQNNYYDSGLWIDNAAKYAEDKDYEKKKEWLEEQLYEIADSNADYRKEQLLLLIRDYYPSCEIYEKVVDYYCDSQNYQEAKSNIAKADELYGNNTEWKDYLTKFAPKAPKLSLDGGKYDERIQIDINSDENAYGAAVYCECEGDTAQKYNQQIKFNEDGEYRVRAWVENGLGYRSEVVEAVYVVKIDKPLPVEFDVASGYYDAPFNVTLSQSQGEKIYYTLDGTEPSSKSLLYEGAIPCGYGVTNLAAISINAKGEQSEVVKEQYMVSQPDVVGANRDGYSGYYYDYVGDEDHDNIYIIDKKNHTRVKTISGWQPYEYKGRLYYMTGESEIYYENNKLGCIDIATDFRECILVDEISNFVIAHDCIYYANSGKLLRCELDGSDTVLINEQLLSGTYISTKDDVVYFVDENGDVLAISQKGEQPQIVNNKKYNDVFLLSEDGSWIYKSGSDLYCEKNGESKLIYEGYYSTSSETEKGLFASTYRTYVDDGVDVCSLSCSKQMVIFKAYHYTEITEILWTNVEGSRTSNGYCNWYTYNLETGVLTQYGENPIFFADGGYYVDATDFIKYEY